MKNKNIKTLVGVCAVILIFLMINLPVIPADKDKKDKQSEKKKKKEKKENKGRGELIDEIYIVRGFSYDPGNRRDPFRRFEKSEQENGDDEPRPEGLKGFLVQGVSLQGVMKTSDGPLAMVMGPDNRGYWIEPGDELYNGKVLNVKFDDRCVVFRKEVEDPLAIKPFTDVEKCLGSFGGDEK